VEQELEKRAGCWSRIWLAISTGGWLILLFLRMGWLFDFNKHSKKPKNHKNTRKRKGANMEGFTEAHKEAKKAFFWMLILVLAILGITSSIVLIWALT